MCVLGPVCTDPGRPADGAQVSESYELGSLVTFTCNRSGFEPEPANKTCVSGSGGGVQWDSVVTPECIGKCHDASVKSLGMILRFEAEYH